MESKRNVLEQSVKTTKHRALNALYILSPVTLLMRREASRGSATTSGELHGWNLKMCFRQKSPIFKALAVD